MSKKFKKTIVEPEAGIDYLPNLFLEEMKKEVERLQAEIDKLKAEMELSNSVPSYWLEDIDGVDYEE